MYCELRYEGLEEEVAYLKVLCGIFIENHDKSSQAAGVVAES
jgi:hypothetical protein